MAVAHIVSACTLQPEDCQGVLPPGAASTVTVVSYDFQKWPWINTYNVGTTIINHPFGNGLYQLSMVMTGVWYIIVIATLKQVRIQPRIDGVSMGNSLVPYVLDHRFFGAMPSLSLWPRDIAWFFKSQSQNGHNFETIRVSLWSHLS